VEPILRYFFGLGLDLTLPMLALSLIPVLFVLHRRGAYVPGVGILAAGVLFFAFVITSQLWSPSRVLARRETLLLLTGGLWALIVPALLLAGERERTLRFLRLTVWIAAVVSAYGWFMRLKHGDFVFAQEWKELGLGAVYQTFGQISALGAVVGLALAIFAPLGSRSQLGWLGLALPCFSLSLVAGSRLAVVGAAAGILALVVGLPVRIDRGRFELSRGHIAIASAVLAGIAILLYLRSMDISLTSLERMRSLIIGIEVDKGILQRFDRPNYLRTAWQLWLSAPILGIGLMGFSVSGFMAEIPGTYPHNVFAQILAETGLVGLALFLLFLWSAYRHFGWKRLREDPLYLTVIAASAVPWAIAMFSGSLGLLWKLYAFIPLAALPPPAARVETPTEAAVRSDLRLPVRH